jgi:hypothetical protein
MCILSFLKYEFSITSNVITNVEVYVLPRVQVGMLKTKITYLGNTQTSAFIWHKNEDFAIKMKKKILFDLKTLFIKLIQSQAYSN